MARGETENPARDFETATACSTIAALTPRQEPERLSPRLRAAARRARFTVKRALRLHRFGAAGSLHRRVPEPAHTGLVDFDLEGLRGGRGDRSDAQLLRVDDLP